MENVAPFLVFRHFFRVFIQIINCKMYDILNRYLIANCALILLILKLKFCVAYL